MAKLLSIFISLVFLATPAVAAKKKKKQNREWYFKVKKIQGQVLAIKPNSSWWRAIHVSQILPEGTLLSVQKGQTATIQIFSPDLGNKVAPVLNFDRWMTTRLDRYSLREVTKKRLTFRTVQIYEISLTVMRRNLISVMPSRNISLKQVLVMK